VVVVVGVLLVGLAALVVSGRGPFGGLTGAGDDPPATPRGVAEETGAVESTATADGEAATRDDRDDPPDSAGDVTAADGPTVAGTDDTAGTDETTGAGAGTDDTAPDVDDPPDTANADEPGAPDDSPDTPDEDIPTDAATAAGVAGTDDTNDLPEPYASVLGGLRPPLTDEERVERALARERGRMRQSALATELEWSASKTSRVLSAMADDGRVEKLRVGRENVVDLVVDGE
jgi:hypothetical protein